MKNRTIFFFFCSCWAIYKFILCDTIEKIYTVCLIKMYQDRKNLFNRGKKFLAKRTIYSRLLFRQFLFFLFSLSFLFHIETTLAKLLVYQRWTIWNKENENYAIISTKVTKIIQRKINSNKPKISRYSIVCSPIMSWWSFVQSTYTSTG